MDTESTQKYVAILRRAGFTITLQRLKILQVLDRRSFGQHHFTAEDVHQTLYESGERISISTVYRVLSEFVSNGIASRMSLKDGHSLFELADTKSHDHMLRLDTMEIIEFSDEAIRKRQEQLVAEQGYDLVGYKLLLFVRPKGANACS